MVQNAGLEPDSLSPERLSDFPGHTAGKVSHSEFSSLVLFPDFSKLDSWIKGWGWGSLGTSTGQRSSLSWRLVQCDFPVSQESHWLRGKALEGVPGMAPCLPLQPAWGEPEQLPVEAAASGRRSGSGRAWAGRGCPRCPGDLGVAFCQASVGAWFLHKAIMCWEN